MDGACRPLGERVSALGYVSKKKKVYDWKRSWPIIMHGRTDKLKRKKYLNWDSQTQTDIGARTSQILNRRTNIMTLRTCGFITARILKDR